MQRFRGGLVFKAHRLYVSLNSRLESNKEEKEEDEDRRSVPVVRGVKAGSLVRKHDHYTPARKMRRDVRALRARNHPEGQFLI